METTNLNNTNMEEIMNSNNELLIDQKQQEEFYEPQGFSEPEEQNETESEKIKELLYKFNSLTGGESDFDNFDVKLYRLQKSRGQKPKKEFVEDYDYIPSLSEIRDDYGSGDYVLYLTFMLDGEEKMKTKEFSISAILKKSEQEKLEKEKLQEEQSEKEKMLLQKIEELEKRLISSNEQQVKNENAEMMKLVLQQSENSKNEMREIFLMMNKNQNEIMQKFLEQKNNLPVANPQNDMKTFLQGIELGRDFGFAEGESEKGDNSSMWNIVGEFVAGFFSNKDETAATETPSVLEEYEAKMNEAGEA